MRQPLAWGLMLTMSVSLAFAQEGGEFAPPVPKPTKQHEMLKKDVGKWTAEMKMYMAADAPPMVMPCTEVNAMLENDLWLLSEFESGPFKGRGQFGYDPNKKKFVGTWIDNMNAEMGVMEGDYNEATDELVMYSTMYNPQTQANEKTKSVTKYDGDDAKHFTMYRQDAKAGDWVKSFEISYKRVK